MQHSEECMHVSPAKHSYAWLPRKCDYRTDRQTDRDTDRQTPYKVIPMCRYASQATQKHCVCECCDKLLRNEIRDTTGAKSYHVPKEVDCSTRNVIYCLLCSACGIKVYVGETERSIKERFMEHLHDVLNRADKGINRHFKDHPATDVQITVLAKMFDWSKVCRLLNQERWIKLLNTRFPDGCNVKVNL